MVTIGQFQEIQKINDSNPPLTAEILIVGLLHGLSDKQVRDMPIDSWRELKKAIPDIKTDLPLPSDFSIDGTVYKIDTFFKKSGQFIDFSELNKNTIENLHKIMALFAMPEGEKYMTNFKARSELFKEKCPYEIAHSVAFFFSRLIQELSQSVKIYSQDPGADGMKRNGDGRPRSIISPMGTGNNGNIFWKWIARNFSITWHWSRTKANT